MKAGFNQLQVGDMRGWLLGNAMQCCFTSHGFDSLIFLLVYMFVPGYLNVQVTLASSTDPCWDH